jgi:hypothetical protein
VKQERLTLRLEEDLIAKAKRVARDRGTSVSRMVASFFDSLEDSRDTSRPHGPVTSRLRGSIRPAGEVAPTDEEDYRRYLVEKHGSS